jgi:hypothetical protein
MADDNQHGGVNAPAVIEEASLGSSGDNTNQIQQQIDILEIADPPKQLKMEMRMATKTPSEWLRLLCRDWAHENEAIISAMDGRFVSYKSYLKGQLTSQLLCRLSIPAREAATEADRASAHVDFWKILGVHDEFDRVHIVANVERFCSLYNIRGTEEHSGEVGYNNLVVDSQGMPVDHGLATNNGQGPHLVCHVSERKAQQNAAKLEMRRAKAEIREREREEYTMRKAAEKAAREASREERRRRKEAMKKQREDYIQRQKEAALQRAAELVQSNRVPVEIIQGAGKAAKVAENAPLPTADLNGNDATVSPEPPPKKCRSSIVIHTASDLDQIVTHSNNLWMKYNTIAKEHNQKVNWVVVAKELGIHVKVREKYARMHSRAKARGFDFVNWGHYRVKDYPQYFVDPLGPEQEAAIRAGGTAPLGGVDISARVSEYPGMNADATGVMAHDAISLAAEAASMGANATVETMPNYEVSPLDAEVHPDDVGDQGAMMGYQGTNVFDNTFV